MSHAADANRARMGVESAVSAEDSHPPAQVSVEALPVRLLRRLVADTVLLRAEINQACRDDPFALKEVEHIAHKIRGSAAVLGFHRVSAIGEAIERLAAGVIAQAEAHGPFAESALVQQISYCIEQLAKAVDEAQSEASSSVSPSGTPVS